METATLQSFVSQEDTGGVFKPRSQRDLGLELWNEYTEKRVTVNTYVK